MEKKYFDLIVKDLCGEISPEEKTILNNWLPGNEAKYQDLKNLWDKTFVKEEFEIDTNAAWDDLKSRISRSEQPGYAKFRNTILRIAAAAVIVLVATLYLLRNSSSSARIDSIASNDNIEIFYLPDSTQVWLNKNSTLTIEKDFEGKERRVKLVGEAYFKVKRDPMHPFIITAGSSVTKVLGTEFEIKAYPDNANVEINVQSGKVEFSSIENKSSSILLVKDEKGMFDRSTGSVKKIVTEVVKEETFLPNTVAKTFEKSEDKHLKEITSPKVYLKNNFNWKDNLFKQVIVEGEVANQAIFTSYKNIRIRAVYHTDKNKVGVEYYTISKDLEPGSQAKYKFRLGNWFRQASKVELEIEDAHAIE